MDTNTVEQTSVPATDSLGRRITRRRLRSAEEKRGIVQETLRPGVSVAEVARRHGLNANLLFSWLRQHEQGVLAEHTRRPKAAKLLPVRVDRNVSVAPRESAPAVIEIELPCGARVRVLGEVVVERLTAVLSALAHR